MASYERKGNGLTVSGPVSKDEIDELLKQGMELLVAEAPRVLLDIRKAELNDSSFVGAVAQLGAEARSNSKSLIVRADGKIADLLVWAGLHRVVTLYVSNTSAPVNG